MHLALPSSVPPKVLEAVGCHFGVPNRVLDVLVTEPSLQGPGVVTIIGQFEPAGMAKHVRVDREWHLGGLPEALDEPMEPNGTDGPAASETNTWASLGYSRRSLRSARISSPRIGWTPEMPFLTR